MTISSRNVFGDLSHSAMASCVYFIDNYLVDIFFKWKFSMKWKILSFSKFLGAMLGQISRTHFLFNGKFAIEISWARNWIHFFHWQILSATVRSKDFLLSFQLWQIPQGKNCKDKQLYFFNGIFLISKTPGAGLWKHMFLNGKQHAKHNHTLDVLKEKLTSNITFCPHVVAFRQNFRKFPGQKFQSFLFRWQICWGRLFSPSWWQIL